MAGFDDLIEGFMPYGAREQISGAAGSDWEWSYTIQDNAGNNVDMTTGYTGLCQLRRKVGDTVALTPTVTFPAAGQVKVTATKTQTAALAAGFYLHEVEVTRTSDGKTVKLVGAGDAQFTVKAEVTV